MLFNKTDLRDLIYDEEYELDGKVIKLIENEFYKASRWSLHYRLVFSYDDKFYTTRYKCGATEIQDEEPFENDPDKIECEEVIPVEVTKIVYQRIDKSKR